MAKIRIDKPVKYKSPQYGLVEAVGVTPVADERWQYYGLTYQSTCKGKAECYEIGCDVDYGEEGKTAGADPVNVDVCVFNLVNADSCSTVAYSHKDFKKSAEAKLAATEHRAVEAALFGKDSKCGLKEGAEVLCPEQCLSPTEALAALECALAECCGTGYIHVPVPIITYLCSCLTTNADGQLVTYLGNIIIPGVGYDGVVLDEDGEECPGIAAMYATGEICIFKGDLEATPDTNSKGQIDFRTNTVTYRAERVWGIGVDPCCPVYAVNAAYCQ